MDSGRVVVNSTPGIGIGGILTLIFLVLKLAGVIAWPWIWVFAPLWIPIAIVVGFLLLFGIIAFIVSLFS